MKAYPTQVLDLNLGKWGSMKFEQWYYKEDPPVITESWIDAVAPYISHGSLVIDIGAFTGDTSLPYAILTSPLGRVVAFEPGPASHEILLRNIALNDFHWIDPIPKAVTTHPGPHVFNFTDEGLINGGFSSSLDIGPGNCGNPCEFTVIGTPLTPFLQEHYAAWLPRLAFVKIDAEGYDRVILRDNHDLFYRLRPVIQVEVYPYLSDRERQELMEAVVALDYTWEGGESVFTYPDPKPKDIICLPR